MAVEFAQVVACGEQEPFILGVTQPAQEHVFTLKGGDLAEDWLDDDFASGVGGFTRFGA